MSFTPVLDVALFNTQDDGNTSFCMYVVPEDDEGVVFARVYKDGDDHVFETVDGDKYLVPPWDGASFDEAVARPQQLFQPVDRDGNLLPFYFGEFLSSPPAARFGV
ncbi:hypothetical protein [Rhizobium sp. MHM7A]|uniref:hypothetical protein n=1 Tax=Rhizobium sp. MHM7A TaxID=2583233 RepID=UPI001107340E|nr:hypothetical protein [Rhizobium sp. MHM7A]TLX16842.1 hypothetical protein FFR93_05710 [Rhizobium sp. MHM7A]